jgi:hypothetical protein
MQEAFNSVKVTEALNSKSYCWRKDLVSSYESLWSLLNKFALLNFTGAKEIREIIAKDQGKDIYTFWRWNNRADLRYLNGIDIPKLANIFNTSEKEIKAGAVTTFLKQDEIQSLISNVLRFCSKCLKAGFHSTFYQLLFFKNCPFHEERFTTKCPKCKKELPFRLDRSTFEKPYGCPQCRTVFCKKLLKIGCHLPLVKGREEKLELINNWLIERVSSQTLELSVKTNNKIASAREKAQETISNLISYWMEIIKPSDELREILVKNLNNPSNISFYVKTSFNLSKEDTNLNELFNQDWEIELYCIFKSISRYFKKTQLQNHVKCIKNCGQNLWWDKLAISETGNICESANAYILWRMYYENLAHPTNIFEKSKGWNPRYGFIKKQKINWSPPNYDYSKWLLKRIFALECFWLFYECKLLARTFNQLNIYSFNTRFITNGFVPYWITKIIDKRSYNLYEIHRWGQTNELNELMTSVEHD